MQIFLTANLKINIRILFKLIFKNNKMAIIDKFIK